MKVLLISANKEMLPDPVAPLGIAYLAAALTDNHHQVEVVDLCFVQDDEKVLAYKLKIFKPDIIGLSIRNIDNVSFPNSVSYLDFYKEVVSWCRTYTSVPIIAGGAGFSLMPFHILRYLDLDYGIRGEGEETLPKLITAITRNETDIQIPGVITSQNIPHPPPEQTHFLDIDQISFPKREVLDNISYMNYGGMGNIQTKRGCAFNCSYCTYPMVEGKTVRLRTARNVVDEIEHMKHFFSIDTLFVVDNVFNYPLDHARTICREIIKRKVKVRWSCYSNPAFITRELISLMKDAGCTGIEFGTDSCAEPVLKRLRKNFSIQEIRNASAICRELDMSFCHDILLGAPGETRDTLSETLRVMEETDPTAVIIMIGIRIFPGTALASFAEAEGVIPEAHLSLNPAFYIAPEVRPFIVDCVQEYSLSHNCCIVPGMNIMNDLRIQKKLRHYGIKGPLWEHMGIRRQRGATRPNEGICY